MGCKVTISDLEGMVNECVSQVLTERIKTRDEYAVDDHKEMKRLFKSLIGIFNRCQDPKAEKIKNSLIGLMEKADNVDFTTFKRRYNYTTVQRQKEKDEDFNNGFNAALDQIEEDFG